MVSGKFRLDVISRHPEFNGRAFAKHELDRGPTIGVWGDEPFELRFKNNSSERVQVRLAVDGTDVLTAKQASVATTGKMWLVQPWQTLSLEAWPETNESGARFVFRSEENSVALHTHGNMSQKGTIAAAVFTESAQTYRRGSFPYSDLDTYYGADSDSRLESLGQPRMRSLLLNDSSMTKSAPAPSAAVGAGETIKQAIASTTGLTAPVLNQVITLNYMWWDDLRAELERVKNMARPSGFADYKPIEKLANLGATPRIPTTVFPPRAETKREEFQRVV